MCNLHLKSIKTGFGFPILDFFDATLISRNFWKKVLNFKNLCR